MTYDHSQFYGSVEDVAEDFRSGNLDWQAAVARVHDLLDPEYVHEWPESSWDAAEQLLDAIWRWLEIYRPS
ncbi:MAG: hypothetical protein WC145_05920 [Aliarcobacter sp.]